MSQPELHAMWVGEVTEMRTRIKAMREKLFEVLSAKVPGRDFSYFINQRGMFSYTGFTPEQVDRLREEFAVYLVRSAACAWRASTAATSTTWPTPWPPCSRADPASPAQAGLLFVPFARGTVMDPLPSPASAVVIWLPCTCCSTARASPAPPSGSAPPSTVSKTLNQLRDLLGDQLLYRQGNQLLLTPFAERLGPTLHRLLSELNGLTGQGGFDPASWQGQLKFALRERHGLAHGAHPGAADARGAGPGARHSQQG